MSTAKSRREIYLTPRWRRLRASVIQEAGYLCERCREEGRTAGAVLVHHKRPISKPWRGDPWDRGNLEALCNPCHVERHKVLDAALPTEKRRSSDAWDHLVTEALEGIAA